MAAVLLLATGCGSSGEAAATEAKPTKTASAVATVSESAVCSLLVDDDDSALNGLVEYATLSVEEEKSTTERSVAEANLEEIRDVARRAPAEMKTQLNALAGEVDSLFDAIDNNKDWDSTGFKASGLDLASKCQELGY